MTIRVDFSLISSWIAPKSRVLDLGCGQGTLLTRLESKKSCRIQGVEMDTAYLLDAVKAGVPVIHMNIDKELDLFEDSSYDVVILSRTLQAVHHPATVLRHMLRIAPIGVVSMPNFAYWRNRVRLAWGRAPVSKDLPYAWHDSPNVHFGSTLDLEDLFAEMDLSIDKCVPLSASGRVSKMPFATRNWSSGAVLYQVSNHNQDS
ncbi:MAG: methionine biosynthesis protein MetW [Propionibacteriaceae bacterium]|jgi:methionine biosynthesis protein MetW|nr:methionine biosynthesis protein MetW [Propionibacteriaceae bacterium]